VQQTYLEPRVDGNSRHIESSDDSKDADAKERSWPFRPQRCSAFGLSTICTHPSSEHGIPMEVFRRHSYVKPNRTETTNHKLGAEIHTGFFQRGPRVPLFRYIHDRANDFSNFPRFIRYRMGNTMDVLFPMPASSVSAP
jgi:hypothetical protein